MVADTVMESQKPYDEEAFALEIKPLESRRLEESVGNSGSGSSNYSGSGGEQRDGETRTANEFACLVMTYDARVAQYAEMTSEIHGP